MDKNWETPIKNGQGHNGLGFLFKIVNVQYHTLNLLCKDEAFVSKMAPLVNSNFPIDANIIYDLLKEIALPFIAQELTPEFKAAYKAEHGTDAYRFWSGRRSVYKKAMSDISKQLYGDPNYWKNNLN